MVEWPLARGRNMEIILGPEATRPTVAQYWGRLWRMVKSKPIQAYLAFLIIIQMHQLDNSGVQIIPHLLPQSKVESILESIGNNPYNDGFGVREFLSNNPDVVERLKRTPAFGQLLNSFFNDPVCVRSIYFDKPPRANWVVGWHQDLTMNLTSLQEVKGWQNVRTAKARIVGQPPIDFLEEMVTLRIHLDDTDGTNGALRVVVGSHLKGVIRTDDPAFEELVSDAAECHVRRGGVMLMKPLTLHASRRTTQGNASRRVIHLEFLDQVKIGGLELQENTAF